MIICVLSMFSGWKPSYYVPSYSTTSESGGYRTTSATNALNFAGKGNILGRNQGWLIVALTIVLLYLLAKPRATLSIGARWAILLISVFTNSVPLSDWTIFGKPKVQNQGKSAKGRKSA